MATEALSQAFASGRQVLANVTRDQLSQPTPCRSWDVAALINHMVGAPRVAVGILTAGTEAGEDGVGGDGVGGDGVGKDGGFAAGDLLVAYDETAAATLAAFGAPGALERTVTLPFGDLPVEVFMTFVALDQYAHGWDLARATGQPTDLEPILGAQLLPIARTVVSEDMRGPDGERAFGLEQEAPAGAPIADQLAAFLGREA